MVREREIHPPSSYLAMGKKVDFRWGAWLAIEVNDYIDEGQDPDRK